MILNLMTVWSEPSFPWVYHNIVYSKQRCHNASLLIRPGIFLHSARSVTRYYNATCWIQIRIHTLQYREDLIEWHYLWILDYNDGTLWTEYKTPIKYDYIITNDAFVFKHSEF